MSSHDRPARRRLPVRRPNLTHVIKVGDQVISVGIGIDPRDGRPREIFMTGAKDGSALAAILDDAAVVISVALQHGVPAEALAKSVGRLPAGSVAPADLDWASEPRVPASPIAAALDLVLALEREEKAA